MKKLFLIISTFLLFFSSFSQTKILMNNKNGIYTIPCIINGVSMDFVLDTGASNVVISTIEASFLFKQGLITIDDIKDTKYSQVADGSIIEGTSLNIKKIQIGNKIIEDVEALVLNNAKSPLLLGQTALQRLGKYSIEDNYFIFNDGSISDKIDYSTIELNATNLRKVFIDNEVSNYENYNDKYFIHIDSLKEKSLNSNGEASFKLSEIYENLYFSFYGSDINEEAVNYEKLLILKERLNNECIYLTERAIEQKYKGAYLKMGVIYYNNNRNNNEKALKYYKLAYEKDGCVSCATKISELNLRLKNEKEAFNWAFKASTIHGDSWWFKSQGTSMGDFYKNGIGTIKNINEALKWYLKDEEFLKIAHIYYLGKDKSVNLEQAEKYYIKAIEKEISFAKQMCKCDNYEDYEKDLLYNKTAGMATVILFFIYNDENHKKFNSNKALEYLKESANVYYNDIALDLLGQLHEEGITVLKDPYKSFSLFYESAILDNNVGQYDLGRCYLYGIGTDKNLTKAAHWMKLSYENGYKEAKIIWDKFELWKNYEEIDGNEIYLEK